MARAPWLTVYARPMYELVCRGCRVISDAHATGWHAYRTDNPDESEPSELAFYCPLCAERKFGAFEHLEEDVAAATGE